MGLTDIVDRVIGRDGDSVSVTVYECENCEKTFESAKDAERAQCPECLSNEISRAGDG